MKSYVEKQCDLFEEYGDKEDVYFAHCISADCAMGAGIAVQFVDWFKKEYDFNLRYLCYRRGANEGTCIETRRLFNLVTEEHCWDKPTYSSLERSLKCMAKTYMQNYTINSMDGTEAKVTTIVMPRIGCGLDQLEWTKVRNIIFKVFKYIPVNIIVCYL